MGFTPLPQVKQAQSGFDTDPQKEANSKCKNLSWKWSASISQMLNLQGWTHDYTYRFQLSWKFSVLFQYIFYKKYWESKYRVWRTIFLLLLSSVTPKFTIGSLTYTCMCVFVHMCRSTYVCVYIKIYLKTLLFRRTHSTSCMKSRKSTQEFWQWPWQKQKTTSWEVDGRKMPPKRAC